MSRYTWTMSSTLYPTTAGGVGQPMLNGVAGLEFDSNQSMSLAPTWLHTFSPTGAYANEMAGIVDDAEKYLRKPNNGDHPSTTATKAVLFDVDDTLLNTYSYEIYTNFVFSPTSKFHNSSGKNLRAGSVDPALKACPSTPPVLKPPAR